MVYESQVSFTLDTVCPWTYLGRRRFLRALDQVQGRDPSVNFHVKYMPFQLYPDAPEEGEDRLTWYRKSRYGDSDEKMATYMTIMAGKGAAEEPPIDFKFGGTIANTLQAHRVIQHFQETKGYDVAEKLVTSLYRRYFEEEQHPSSQETLLAACKDSGVDEDEARCFINDKDDELMDVKMLIREQKSNGIDAVPFIMIEGRRRDFTLEGCREIDEYVKTLEQVVRESK